jgi:hypothetical protein
MSASHLLHELTPIHPNSGLDDNVPAAALCISRVLAPPEGH